MNYFQEARMAAKLLQKRFGIKNVLKAKQAGAKLCQAQLG